MEKIGRKHKKWKNSIEIVRVWVEKFENDDQSKSSIQIPIWELLEHLLQIVVSATFYLHIDSTGQNYFWYKHSTTQS